MGEKQINGISLDPSDIEPAISKLVEVVKSSISALMTSPRSDIINVLQLEKCNGINPFLDKKCLPTGQDWKAAFFWTRLITVPIS